MYHPAQIQVFLNLIVYSWDKEADPDSVLVYPMDYMSGLNLGSSKRLVKCMILTLNSLKEQPTK